MRLSTLVLVCFATSLAAATTFQIETNTYPNLAVNRDRLLFVDWVHSGGTISQVIEESATDGLYTDTVPAGLSGAGLVRIRAGYRYYGPGYTPLISASSTLSREFAVSSFQNAGNWASPWTLDFRMNENIAGHIGNGDIDVNGVIDIADYNALAANFDATGPLVGPEHGDINGDAIVDIADYGLLASSFDAVSLPAVNVQSDTDEFMALIPTSFTGDELVIPAGSRTYSIPHRIEFIGDGTLSAGVVIKGEHTVRVPPTTKIKIVNTLHDTRIIGGIQVPIDHFYDLIFDERNTTGITELFPSTEVTKIKVLDLASVQVVQGSTPIQLNSGKNGTNLWTGGWPRTFGKLESESTPRYLFRGLGNISQEGAEARPEQPMVLSYDGEGVALPMEMATEFNWDETARWRRARYIDSPAIGSAFRNQKFQSRVRFPFTVANTAAAESRNSVVMHTAYTDSDPRIAEISSVTDITVGTHALSEVTFRDPAEYGSNGLAQGSRYRWINEPQFLDEPGEFYVRGGKIYLIPAEGTTFINLSMPAKLGTDRYLHHPANAGFDYPSSGYGNTRIAHTPFLAANLAAFEVQGIGFDTCMGNAIHTEAVGHLKVSYCTFDNFGQAPIISRSGAYRPDPKFANVVLAADGTVSGSTRPHRTTVDKCSFRNGYKEAVRHEKSRISMLLNDTGATPDLQYWYDYSSLGMAEQGALYVAPNATENVLIRNNEFEDFGKLFADQFCVRISRGTNRTVVKGNYFDQIGGNGLLYQGTNVTVGIDPAIEAPPIRNGGATGHSNVFKRCAYDMTDCAGIDSFKSLVDLGNVIAFNKFEDIQQYSEFTGNADGGPGLGMGAGGSESGPPSGPGGPPVIDPIQNQPKTEGYKKAVFGIYWDGLLSYQTAHDNRFENCQYAYGINGGMSNLIFKNTYVNSGFMENFREGHNPINQYTGNNLTLYGFNNPAAVTMSNSSQTAHPWMALYGSSGYTRIVSTEDKAGGATTGQTGFASFYKEYTKTGIEASIYKQYQWGTVFGIRGGTQAEALPARGEDFFNSQFTTYNGRNHYTFPLKNGQSGVNPGAFGMIDSGYMFLDKISRKQGTAWMQGYIEPNPATGQDYIRIARPGLPEYEFTSRDNQWADPGQADSFEGYGATGQKKLFFGNVKWTGNGTYKIPPIKVGQDLLWVHVPGYTYKEPTPQAPNPNMDAPLPIMVDKDGRFGLVVPSGVSYVYVKMYGTLWKKIIFNTTGTDSVQVQYWNGAEVDYGNELKLRYGDVNEDNKIVIDDQSGAWDRGYLAERVGGELRMFDPANPTQEDDAIFQYDYVCDLNRDNKVNNFIAGSDGVLFNLLEPEADLAGAQLP